MDLLGRFFEWLDSLHKPQDHLALQASADPGRPVKVTLWGRRFKLQLEIPPAERVDDPEFTPTSVEEVPVPGAGEVPVSDKEDHTDRPVPHAPLNDLRRSPFGLHHIPQRQTAPPEHHHEHSAAFWDILEPTEREALRAVASLRTFAAGVRLMEEGGRADYVMVILGGRVKVCVEENGAECVLAVRGVGQLVGERGALEISVRSATVVALDMIWALVVQTRDFAAFLSVHPRVLGIVEDQLNQRGTGDPAASVPDGPQGDSETEPAGVFALEQHGHDGRAGYSRKHSRTLKGENCTVFLTDVVGFGAHERTDSDRLLIREVLFRTTQSVVEDVPDAHTEDRGDGFLTVVPPDISTAKVIDRLLKELPAALELHNSTQRESARFKLRLAVNVGPVVTDIAGVSGEAIIVAARLVEAPHFKEAIAGSAASLGVIASPFVYEAVIRHGRDRSYVASFSPVPVEVKESRTTAWMKLYDTPLTAFLVPDPTAPDSTLGLLAALELTHEPSPRGHGESQLRAVCILAITDNNKPRQITCDFYAVRSASAVTALSPCSAGQALLIH